VILAGGLLEHRYYAHPECKHEYRSGQLTPLSMERCPDVSDYEPFCEGDGVTWVPVVPLDSNLSRFCIECNDDTDMHPSADRLWAAFLDKLAEMDRQEGIRDVEKRGPKSKVAKLQREVEKEANRGPSNGYYLVLRGYFDAKYGTFARGCDRLITRARNRNQSSRRHRN
jgi:hypothetical protein